MSRLTLSLICCLLPVFTSASTQKNLDNPPLRYTVVEGDTLWGIATRFFNDPMQWRHIWEMSKDTVKQPHRIYPGQVLILGLPPQLRSPRVHLQLITVMQDPVRPPEVLPTPIPAAQAPTITAHVISVLGSNTQTDQDIIVVLDKGRRDGVETGLVLALHHQEKKKEDPDQAATIPDAGYGQLIVFRTFDKVSYASVTEASTPVMLLDIAKTP